jgi:hypothetical protein
MHNKTIAHGCSFTRYGWPCWPKFVEWFNGGITMLNKGRSGSGNETISRAAINSAMKHTQIDHMYIMWSGTDRYEVITKEHLVWWTPRKGQTRILQETLLGRGTPVLQDAGTHSEDTVVVGQESNTLHNDGIQQGCST